MDKRVQTLLSSLIVCTALTACSLEATSQTGGEQQPVTTPSPVTTADPTQPTAPTYAYTAPLTGLGTDHPTDSRPVMVMINNHPKARPQSGLSQADMVYEVLAEGEVTRFLAIFQSQKPKVIGPVRSIRPYFIQVGTGFDAVLVHAGGSPEALETLAQSDFSYINEINNAPYFWRESFRRAPHNLYTNLDRITKAINAKGFRPTGEIPYFPFVAQDSQITEGSPASKINITFHPSYKASYTYSAEKGRYLRFTQGQPHNDLNTNEQLSVKNLLIISAEHQVLDNEGRRHVDVVGPGDGYLFQQGKVRPVKWKRSGGVIRAYEDEALTKELPLLPGNTWVNIVPDHPGLASAVTYQ
ncbi:DUF3048 domain-containing protein [Brevibacillus dissolubilis]|uniref:DUF3048 domain-containing protein n=1 Tax=Brevibacillus dissolubilis TaxID=1844116 RepID=UPI00111715D3|nr:DUF3048 domain-containing protein [Brevibacillus dissolubilis]